MDDLTDKQLEDELRRRRAARDSGVCDYCGRLSSETSCRFVDRHALPRVEREAREGRLRVAGSHAQALTTEDRDGRAIPPTCAHCGKHEMYCNGVKP